MNILAIIPARGGSKRIPNKNMKLLNNKPLLHYTIEAAKKSKMIDYVVVSSDDDNILQYAIGQLIPGVIRRPLEISKDNSPTEEALIHTVKYLEEKSMFFDYIVLLQPTSPLRTAEQIDEAIQLAIKEKVDSVVSVCEVQHHYLMGEFNGKVYVPHYHTREFSNNQPKKHQENGAIFVTKTDFLLRNRTRLGGKIRAYIMDVVSSIDIDTMEDFELVEKIMGWKG